MSVFTKTSGLPMMH